MVAFNKQHLQKCAPFVSYGLRAVIYFHTFAGGQGTGALMPSIDINHTNSAASMGFIVGVMTQVWYVLAGLQGGVHDGLTVLKALVQLGHVDNGHSRTERNIAEALLGKSAMQGHLATFKAGTHSAAGTGLLPLVSATGCFTQARAFPTAKPLTTVLGSRIRFQFVKIHSM